MSKPNSFTLGAVASRAAGRPGKILQSARFFELPVLEKPRPVRGCTRVVGLPNSYKRHLVLMVKEPCAGRVKTRLALGIGNARAAAFYRTATNTVLSRVSRTHRWQTYLAIAPDTAALSRAWPARSAPGAVLRFAQGSGDLGQRMQRVFDGLPSGPVVIIGSDVPCITQGAIVEAFQSLGQADAVIGPSPDGGYWLIGMKRVPRITQAFAGVRWSSATTLSDTLENFEGLKVARCHELADIDELSDYERMGAAAVRRVLPVSANRS